MKSQFLAAIALASALPHAVGTEPPLKADCACQKAPKPARKPIQRPPAAQRPPVVSNVITLPPPRLESPCGPGAIGSGPGTSSMMRDHNCEVLRNSALLDSMGKRDAALAMLCTDARMRQALESTGTACPAATPLPQEVRDATAQPGRPPATDPPR